MVPAALEVPVVPLLMLRTAPEVQPARAVPVARILVVPVAPVYPAALATPAGPDLPVALVDPAGPAEGYGRKSQVR